MQINSMIDVETSTDTHHRQCAVFGKFLTGLVIDVGKGVQFICHDVDVVATDTM